MMCYLFWCQYHYTKLWIFVIISISGNNFIVVLIKIKYLKGKFKNMLSVYEEYIHSECNELCPLTPDTNHNDIHTDNFERHFTKRIVLRDYPCDFYIRSPWIKDLISVKEMALWPTGEEPLSKDMVTETCLAIQCSFNSLAPVRFWSNFQSNFPRNFSD